MFSPLWMHTVFIVGWSLLHCFSEALLSPFRPSISSENGPSRLSPSSYIQYLQQNQACPCASNDVLCLEHWLWWSSFKTSNEICTYDLLLNMVEKWPVLCTAAESTWLLLCSIFTRTRPDQKCSLVAIFTYDPWQNSKVFMLNCVPPYNPFSHRRNVASCLQLFHYFHGRCVGQLGFLASTHPDHNS